jgi:hypothetical protein
MFQAEYTRPKRDDVIRGWRKYNQDDQVKEDELGRTSRTHGEKRNTYRILVGNPHGKRPLGRPRRRWEENTETELGEEGWGGMESIDRDEWKALVNTVMNLRIP